MYWRFNMFFMIQNVDINLIRYFDVLEGISKNSQSKRACNYVGGVSVYARKDHVKKDTF